MPEIKSKKKAAPKPKSTTQDRPVIYPEVTVSICSGEDAITADHAKKLLGWETDEEYAVRTGDAPGSKMFGDPLLVDEEGKRVQCWNNTTNRPFGEGWARSLAQDILTKNWKFNLETIIVSQTGLVTSGQHRLIALVLAYQMWKADREGEKAYAQYWGDREPTIEALIAFGGSEEPAVLNTVDNVKPRSLSDVFYTSGVFRDSKLTSIDRKELTRMLDAAVDFLWKRTGCGTDSVTRYQTHSASVAFLDRHKKLLQTVRHIFDENRERSISLAGLPASGEIAGAMFLQAATLTDGGAYKNGDPPSQDLIDFGSYDRAAEFWSLFAAKSPTLKGLRDALASYIDSVKSAGGSPRSPEKLAIIAKAWHQFRKDPTKKIREEAVQLEKTEPNADGLSYVVQTPDIEFGGIDVGFDFKKEEVIPDETEIENGKQSERAKALDKKAKAAKEKEMKQASAPTKINPVLEEVNNLREKAPGHLLLLKSEVTGNYTAYDKDAEHCHNVLGVKLAMSGEVAQAVVEGSKITASILKLTKAKHKVATLSKKRTGPQPKDFEYEVKTYEPKK